MRSAVLVVVLLITGCAGADARPSPQVEPTVSSTRGVVVSVSADASVVGRDVMARGGNAVDAAVATAFALAVTHPEAGNIGGGGFMVIHFSDVTRKPVVIDYRETAPAAVDAETFRKPADRTQIRLAGVPGTVRGLAMAHARYCKLPWRELVMPAVALARDGFVMNADLARHLQAAVEGEGATAEFRRVFAKPGGAKWAVGDRLVQPDLAKTLEAMAEGGADAFYRGANAERIVGQMKRDGGLMTAADLAGYRAVEREPVHGTFRGLDVYAPPPPSSGGTCLIEMLNLCEALDLRAKGGRFEGRTVHLMAEVQKRAYADRARYLGDPDFLSMPKDLTSKARAKEMAGTIELGKATAAETLAPEVKVRDEAEDTTHFSVIDGDGMAVSNTYTLENSFGGKIVVAGAGFILNNELGDFNPQPGVTTRGGQIGTAANEAAAGKRPLSSMCPTIVADHGKVVVVTGSPGGRTIINTVFCVLVNRLEYGMSPRASVDGPRQHHQWFPDRLYVERELLEGHTAAIGDLRGMGQRVHPTSRVQGDAHSIFFDAHARGYVGVADQRRSGAAAGR